MNGSLNSKHKIIINNEIPDVLNRFKSVNKDFFQAKKKINDNIIALERVLKENVIKNNNLVKALKELKEVTFKMSFSEED